MDGRLTDSTSWKLGICEDIDILNFFVIAGLYELTCLEHNVPYRRCVELLFDDFPTLLKCCEVIEQKLGTWLARSASIICQRCKYAQHAFIDCPDPSIQRSRETPRVHTTWESSHHLRFVPTLHLRSPPAHKRSNVT